MPPVVRAALITALADANIPAARAALQALAPFLADDRVLAAVVALLSNPCLYHAATQLLLPLAHEATLQQMLVPLLDQGVPIARAGAAQVLAAAGSDPAVLTILTPYLPPHPEDHPQGRISASIIRGLRHQVACPAVQAVLLPRLADNRWWIVAAVLDALAPVAADPAIQPAIVARLTDANDQIRHAACGALRPLYPLPLLPTPTLPGSLRPPTIA